MWKQDHPDRRGERLRTSLWPTSTAIGCLITSMIAPGAPRAICVGVLVIAVLRPRPLFLSIGLILLCGSLASQAREGEVPLSAGVFSGIVQLASDPSLSGGSTTADARSASGRVRLVAHGTVGARLAVLQAGDRVAVAGSTIADAHLDRSRHQRAMVALRSLGDALPSTPAVTCISGLRDAIERGGRAVPPDLRPLYLGLVIGDDRGASPGLGSDLRTSGLAHLAVVSGENLMFVMVLLSPVLGRVGLRARTGIVLFAVVTFASITRFEPSILRASAMAIVAAIAASLGRPATPIRIMSLAVITLMVCDPLLADSLSFRLSLAATAGIVLLAGPIAGHLPFRRRVAVMVALPIAAQLGVAPIAIPLFGPQPLLAIPANVLAEPAAAVVMMWGCTVGVLAGCVGGGAATVLQWPASLALEWIRWIAHLFAQLPSPMIDLPRLGALVAVWALLVARHRRRRRRSSGLGVGAPSGPFDHDGGR